MVVVGNTRVGGVMYAGVPVRRIQVYEGPWGRIHPDCGIEGNDPPSAQGSWAAISDTFVGVTHYQEDLEDNYHDILWSGPSVTNLLDNMVTTYGNLRAIRISAAGRYIVTYNSMIMDFVNRSFDTRICYANDSGGVGYRSKAHTLTAMTDKHILHQEIITLGSSPMWLFWSYSATNFGGFWRSYFSVNRLED